MNERERVLELVKKGVLSTEEALDLLESMAQAKDEKQIQQENEKVTAAKLAETKEPTVENTPEDEYSDLPDPELDAKEADRQNLEKILDELATEANKASAELDEVNVEIAGARAELADAQARLMELDTKEELDAFSDEDAATRNDVEAEIKDIQASLDKLIAEKADLEGKVKNIRKNQWQETKDHLASKLEIPEDWKEQANDAFNKAGQTAVEAGTTIGKFLKDTFRSVSTTVNDNVEWKDISLKVPGVAQTKFDHSFEYPSTEATIIDVKVANGNVSFQTWNEPGVKVDAKIKLYGKMDAETPFEAFEARSAIEVNDDHISFQVPNKRIRADLTFYLPARTYDHVAVKLLNGNVDFETLNVKDIYTKSTNGTINFGLVNATMLEVEGVNGNITIKDGEIMDAIVETVNGNVTMTATPQNASVSIVNGDVRLTFAGENLRKVNASSVNGNVKLALPQGLGAEGLARTSLGSINSRLTEVEVIREKKERMNQLLQFRRLADAVAEVDLSTTTGSIFLKDTEA